MKIKGLHYVNQWYNTKKIHNEGVLQCKFLGGYTHQDDVQRILVQPLFYGKGLIEVTTNVHAQILTRTIHSQNCILYSLTKGFLLLLQNGVDL